MENYLQVLEESLYKKLDVLGRIESLCARQDIEFGAGFGRGV